MKVDKKKIDNNKQFTIKRQIKDNIVQHSIDNSKLSNDLHPASPKQIVNKIMFTSNSLKNLNSDTVKNKVTECAKLPN